ncbi:SGNH/GDSL hydrolase family protein [Laspinema olomoucense]|uniref:SGNH/GDSL hydrolase family protein n=1 Tax=Laspinema olomoucense D3b TaxID=2953688 RepID=A0ABT2NBP5_9CYAN|nr:SGNH/GDSL hydrolase family protein [Laspinema sp. D3b]MCT7980118.1 SGNH/GDSL hydrolase family protein [Laspinema sp. D3b]
MSDPLLLAIGLLTQMKTSISEAMPNQPKPPEQTILRIYTQEWELTARGDILPTVEMSGPEFSSMGSLSPWVSRDKLFDSYPAEFMGQSHRAIASSQAALPQDETAPERVAYARTPSFRPQSGPQLYQQRLAALEAGQTYTRIPCESYGSLWANAWEQPTYEQWKALLEREAQAVAKGQGSNRLAVLLGDSISMWFPQDRLPQGPIWLNQGISGDTSRGILSRLSALRGTRPDTIYILAGINDLRQGIGVEEIVENHRQILRRLGQEHPGAQVILQSILPTRLPQISNGQIEWINQQLAAIAWEEGASYLDLYAQFSDRAGNLQVGLTTDGLHLNARGYELWQGTLTHAESWLALHSRSRKHP